MRGLGKLPGLVNCRHEASISAMPVRAQNAPATLVTF